MNNIEKHIETLIEIGKSLIINDFQRIELSKIDFVNRQSIETWDSTLTELSDTDVVNLFKGIVLAEKTLNWIGGSVAGGVWIYRNIQKRKLDNDYQIANWALMTTDNSYIPFGSLNHSKKNVVDYHLMKQEFSHRKAIEQILREKRLLVNKISGLENKIQRQENNISELKARLEFAKLSPNELAEKIISDNEHPIYFYYNEIEKLINEKSVDKKLLQSILNKFKEKEKKNVKDLKNRLLIEITNR